MPGIYFYIITIQLSINIEYAEHSPSCAVVLRHYLLKLLRYDTIYVSFAPLYSYRGISNATTTVVRYQVGALLLALRDGAKALDGIRNVARNADCRDSYMAYRTTSIL